MAEKIKDGGPAFPHTDHTMPQAPGMSLRDYFAGQALAGILADDSTVHPHILEMFGGPGMNRGDIAAKYADVIADAMLAARGKRS